MFWVLAVVVMGVAGAAVVFAASREDRAVPDPWGTASDPIGSEPTAASLRSVDLPVVRRGYDPGTVDALLERVAQRLESVPVPVVPVHVGEDDGVAADDPAGPEEPVGSGEELEHGGGDVTRGLDR